MIYSPERLRLFKKRRNVRETGVEFPGPDYSGPGAWKAKTKQPNHIHKSKHN